VPGKFDDLLPNAEEVRAQASRRDSEKADEFVRRLVDAELEKQALVGKLSVFRSEDETLEILSAIIMCAAESGLDEVELYRFAVPGCSNTGATAMLDEGWETTLTGLPRQIHNLFLRYLKPRGYKVRFQVLPVQADGSANVSIILRWNDQL
jgi:hypothetical protein